jgi:hypothetical protein
MKNILASLSAAAILATAIIANAAPAASNETVCPAGAAVAKRSIIHPDGTIQIITRCVLRAN